MFRTRYLFYSLVVFLIIIIPKRLTPELVEGTANVTWKTLLTHSRNGAETPK